MHIKNMSFFAFETHIIWREYDLEDSWYTNLANQMQAKLELLKAEKGLIMWRQEMLMLMF